MKKSYPVTVTLHPWCCPAQDDEEIIEGDEDITEGDNESDIESKTAAKTGNWCVWLCNCVCYRSLWDLSTKQSLQEWWTQILIAAGKYYNFSKHLRKGWFFEIFDVCLWSDSDIIPPSIDDSERTLIACSSARAHHVTVRWCFQSCQYFVNLAFCCVLLSLGVAALASFLRRQLWEISVKSQQLELVERLCSRKTRTTKHKSTKTWCWNSGHQRLTIIRLQRVHVKDF